jgi:excisionase family DNA binding protein
MAEKIAVNVNEAAEMLGVGRDVMYRLILSGDVDSFKVGARRLIPVQGIRDYVDAQTREKVGAA